MTLSLGQSENGFDCPHAGRTPNIATGPFALNGTPRGRLHPKHESSDFVGASIFDISSYWPR